MYDCVVIGSGPGGYVAAIRASQLGFKTAVIEKESPGGVCLNWGCIPTKGLLKSADVLDKISHASDYGINVSDYQVDFAKVIKRSRDIVGRMTKGVEYLLAKNKIDYIPGYGEFTSKNSIKVTSDSGEVKTVEFANAIIATGGKARSFPNLPIDEDRIITYRKAMSLESKPSSMLVIGAGAIGAEFASFYNSMGTKVTIVELQANVLPIEDTDISKEVERQLKKRGIDILTKCSVETLSNNGNGVSAKIKNVDSGQTQEWTGDICLVAVGFEGNTTGIGLENIGVEVDRTFIKTDSHYRTSVPNIYAIGDVIGPPLLAHVASHEGIIACEIMAEEDVHPIDYNSIPACTYCNPQVASIGYTEAVAKEKGYNVKAAKFPFTASGRAVASGDAEGFTKVVIDAETEEVLGIHIVHPEASELIGEASIIKSHEGIASSVLNTIHAHPTLTEGIMEAMGAVLGKAIHI